MIGLSTHFLKPTKPVRPVFGSMVVGVLGAVVGGLMASIVLNGYITNASSLSIIAALIGASFLMIIQKTSRKI